MLDGHSCDGGSPSFPGSVLLPGLFAFEGISPAWAYDSR